ncbi:MAG: hypothetical protein QM484_14480, partial [Woeseiaceae bacterium]
HQSGCYIENLLLQVWASLYRFRDNRYMNFVSYKCIKTIRLSLIGTFKRGAFASLLKAPYAKRYTESKRRY